MFNILASVAGSAKSWFIGIFFSINETLYSFISTLYSFMMSLAQEGNLLIEKNPDLLNNTTEKIYVIIGIVMLFRIGIVLLRYVADPDKVMDKKEGIGRKFIPRILTVLVLLVFMPTFFTWLYALQNDLLGSKFLTTFFQDSETAAAAGSATDDNPGARLGDNLFMSFITFNAEADGKETIKAKYDEEMKKLTAPGNYNANMVNHGEVSIMVTDEFRGSAGGKYYTFEYSYFISMIVAIVIIVMLIATVFQVALRVFKLLALEIIAPIPIVMYLDPTTKPGENPLEKWFKIVIQTYADLFLRIIFILFVSIIITNIAQYVGPANDNTNMMLKLFLIFGALMFMNVGPDMIMGLFGKQAEKGGFNPLAQMKAIPGIGAGMASVPGGAVKGVGGAIGGAWKGASQGGLKGGLAGAALGANAGIKSKNILSSADAGRDAMANALATGPGAAGGSIPRRLQRVASNALRSDANKIGAEAAKYTGGPDFTSSKTAYEGARNAHTSSLSTLNGYKTQRTSLQSQMAAYQAQGLAADAQRVGGQLTVVETSITAQEADVAAKYADRQIAATDYNSKIDKYNTYHTDYKNAIAEVNKKTGRDATEYTPERGASEFKEMGKVD